MNILFYISTFSTSFYSSLYQIRKLRIFLFFQIEIGYKVGMNVLSQIIVIGCVFSACAKPPEHARHAQDTAKAFAKKAETEFGLTSLGSGGFYTNKKIDSLYLDFEMKKNQTQEEAKALLTKTVNDFVHFVNESEEIRPFLQTYPITPNQISVSIGFINEKREPFQGFSQIVLYEGITQYSVYIPEKKEYSPFQKELYPSD
jgi:hypothetical protein